MALKSFKFHGKTIEEIKAMSEEEFLALIPSRARRSVKRGLTQQQEAFVKKLTKGKDGIETHARDMIVLPRMIGKTVKIYNGKEFFPVTLGLEHLGMFFGELALTRKKAVHNKTGVGAPKKVEIRK
jgi:small subunit ribosomal protein S19